MESSHQPSTGSIAFEQENQSLRQEVQRLRRQLASAKLVSCEAGESSKGPAVETSNMETFGWDRGIEHSLTKPQIERYSRQLLLGSFGVQGEIFLHILARKNIPRVADRLCRASVLVIGAGGLGCPAAIYLAAAGVGRLGIVDKDSVDSSNLHRQILHREQDVGAHKAVSAAAACRAINSSIKVEAHTEGFFPSNAVELVSDYDVVLDASDNAPTRYLISDACAVAHRPLVSGAAIGTDGQLTVYCHDDDGPCYRCLFPEPPQPESCARCSDAGVLGPVPGLIGTLQALEAIKIISGVGQVLSRKLLLVDCLTGRFHQVKLRSRAADCLACGPKAVLTASSIAAFDYFQFTGQAYDDRGPADPDLLPASQRLSAEALKRNLTDPQRSSNGPQLILDVRPREQFDIAHLPGSVSCPFDENHPERFCLHLQQLKSSMGDSFAQASMSEDVSWAVVCRRGNDSQRVVAMLRDDGFQNARDLEGGLLAWSHNADPTFPVL